MKGPFFPLFPCRLATPFAITNATLVSMATADLVPHQTLLVEDGTISAIAPSRELQVDGIHTIDATGLFAMPGLADMHVHYWDPREAPLFLANGVTLVRNMSGAPFHLALSRLVDGGELPGPRVVTTSPVVDGPGDTGLPMLPGSAVLHEPEEAAALVTRFAERGYEQTKALSWLRLNVLHALGRAAADAGLRVVGHCPEGVSFEEGIAAGITCFEHLAGIGYGHLQHGAVLPTDRRSSLSPELFNPDILRSIVHNLDLDSIRRLASRMAAADVWNCPTIVVRQQLCQEPGHSLADPNLRYVPPAWLHAYSVVAKLPRGGLSFDAWAALVREQAELFIRVVSVLHSEGAPLLVGTDTPNPFVVQGFSVHQELANFVAAGMTPYQAIRCATVEPARFLGESHIWGTLAPGMRADVLLLRSNPLDDVTAVSQLEGVAINGFYLSRPRLDALLEQRAAFVPSPILDDSARGATGDSADESEVSSFSGDLVERVGDDEVGRLSYRHVRLSSGDWFVEERYGADTGLGNAYHRTSRLRLTPDFLLRRATVIVASEVGQDVCDIAWSDEGNYRIWLREVDGQLTATVARCLMAVPSERIAVTALPLMLASGSEHTETGVVSAVSVDMQGSTVPVLDPSTNEASVVTVNIDTVPALHDDEENGAQKWRLSVDRPGQPCEQEVSVSADGQILGLTEASVVGLRIWTRA